MDRKLVRFLGYIFAVGALLMLPNMYVLGGFVLTVIAVLIILIVFPPTRDSARRRLGWVPDRNATVVLGAIWIGILISPLFVDQNTSHSAQSPDRLTQLAEAKCRSFGQAIEKNGWLVSERDASNMCEVVDRDPQFNASVELSNPKLSVSFFGGDKNIVSFSAFHHPDEKSPFQQVGYLDEVYAAGVQAAGYTQAPSIELMRSLYLRLGNTGKDIGIGFEFKAQECVGDVYVYLSTSDSSKLAAKTGNDVSVHEYVAVGRDSKECGGALRSSP